MLLIEESKESGRKVHTSILDTSRLFTFPDVTLSSSYSIRLETSLSPSMYSVSYRLFTSFSSLTHISLNPYLHTHSHVSTSFTAPHVPTLPSSYPPLQHSPAPLSHYLPLPLLTHTSIPFLYHPLLYPFLPSHTSL